MRSGARPAPRLGFSIGNGELWRACESIAGVQMAHSSTRRCFGEDRIRPRAIPGSVRRLRHIPTEEPLSFNPTARQKKRALATQQDRTKPGLKFAPNRYKNYRVFPRTASAVARIALSSLFPDESRKVRMRRKDWRRKSPGAEESLEAALPLR
jgi:hypothetical protein